MSKLLFITGSKNKFSEVKELLGDIDQLDINLPEIQELDSHEIIKAKLHEAFRHHSGEFIVEDTSLSLSCLGGFPGPLIKWFRKGVGNDGIVKIVDKLGDNRAIARTIVGYAKNMDSIEFFEGSVSGTIVAERVQNGFGWDGIFLPDATDKTFAEMTPEEKNQISHRARAIAKLKESIS